MTSVRARQMRRMLARWQRSGLTLREFGEKRGIPLSTLSWWWRVFRCAGDEEGNGTAVENAVVFTEVPKPAKAPETPSVILASAEHCGTCNTAKVRIGADITEELDYVPASFVIREYVRPKYDCCG